MNLLILILYCSILIWLITPIRQYKTKYFFMFLVLGLSDLLSRIFFGFGLIEKSNNINITIASLLIIFSLLYFRHIYRYLILFVLLLIFTYVLYFVFYTIENENIFQTFLQLIILVLIFADFLNHTLSKKEISIFLTILLFYQTTNLLKFVNIFTETIVGYFYFFVTSFFQIAIGLFFCFVNIDKPKLAFTISNKHTELKPDFKSDS